MATLLGSIFLDTKLDADFVYAFLVSKVREIANENRTLESLKDIVLKALAAIDYLLLLDLFELPVEDISYMSTQTIVQTADEVESSLTRTANC